MALHSTLMLLPSFVTQFRRAFAADVLKLRNTAAIWLTLGSGMFLVALSFVIFYFKGHLLIKPGQNPWNRYVLQSWQTATGLLLPLFVVLLTSLVIQVENKSVAWKHIYAQPVRHSAILSSKLTLLIGLNLLAQLAYVILLLCSGALLGLLRPELNFYDYKLSLLAICVLFAHTFVATLGLLGIQYIASLWWRSFVLPVALGLGATIMALTLMNWEYISWIPYAAPLLSLRSASESAVGLQVANRPALAELLSLGWFGVAMLVGYGILRRRPEK